MTSELKSYDVPECTCRRLPHKRECPLAPFFEEIQKLKLDEAEPGQPFILTCPHCNQKYLQTQHAVGYDYSPTHGQTDQGDLPLVCPLCSWTDKQTLPAIVGFDPKEGEDDRPFAIMCPECETVMDRTDGCMDVWLEKEILMGVESAKVRGLTYKKGQVIAEFTALSLSCLNCGYSFGEDPE